jgi:glycosyltransferase involved in cell wall biosynthesis
MPRYDLVFWEPVVSPHKLGFFAALAQEPGVASVTHIADRPLTADRVKLGWTTDDVPGIRTRIAPTADEIDAIVRDAPTDAVHVFSGIRRVPSIVAGLDAVLRRGRRFGLLHEPRDWTGLAGGVRLVQSWLTEGRLRRRADFVLGIGRQGPMWFRSAGYAPRKLFPFAYFLPFPPETAPTPPSLERRTVVGYLGRLTQPKGFGAFADAVGKVRQPIEVRIAGLGPMEDRASALVADGPVPARYVGAIPYGDVGRFLAGLDVLVVPSVTKDGWGAVVGEALAAGVAVVASTFVGASICLDDPRAGHVLADTRVETIAAAIDEVCAGPHLGADSRAWRANWARAHLSAEAGARHLVHILRSLDGLEPRPLPFYERP